MIDPSSRGARSGISRIPTSRTLSTSPRTFNSPRTKGGAPGIRVMRAKRTISRTSSISHAKTSVPTRKSSDFRSAAASGFGAEESKELQGVREIGGERAVGGADEASAQVFRKWRADIDLLAAHRMTKHQPGSVKKMALRRE